MDVIVKSLNEKEEHALKNYVHTPAESHLAYVKLGSDIYGTTGISTGSRVLDHYIVPTRPNWIRLWTAAPGNGKSSMLRVIAMTEARRLVQEQLTDKHYVAFLTYEEAVDAQEIFFQKRGFTTEEFWRGKIHPDLLKKGMDRRVQVPIYFFGESMMKSNLDSQPMTMDVVMDGFRALWKIQGLTPSLIVVDYVQEITVKGKPDQRTANIIEAVRDLIQVGIRTGCAIELGNQAKQSTLERPNPLPKENDGEYSFYPHQKTTNHVGLWRPWTTHKDNFKVRNEGVKVNGVAYSLEHNLMIARPVKHRPGVLRMSLPFKLDVDKLEITDFPGLIK